MDPLPGDRDDAAFDAFVAARLPHLLKLGRALSGDEQRGADLVQDALERALPRWRKLDDPERVDIDGITVATSVKAVGGSLFVTGSSEATRTDLASSDVLRVSDDGGTGWTPLAAPCTSAQVTAAAGAVFAVCHDAAGDRATVHRWTPGQDRFEEYAATVLSEGGILLALDDERLAITDDADERILTATTDIPTDFAQSDDTPLIDSAVLGERLYVVSLAGMSMSEDVGRTWSQISQ